MKSVVENNLSDTKNETIDAVLKEIEEKCYKNLMEICHGLSASLNISINDVLPIQVMLFCLCSFSFHIFLTVLTSLLFNNDTYTYLKCKSTICYNL